MGGSGLAARREAAVSGPAPSPQAQASLKPSTKKSDNCEVSY